MKFKETKVRTACYCTLAITGIILVTAVIINIILTIVINLVTPDLTNRIVGPSGLDYENWGSLYWVFLGLSMPLSFPICARVVQKFYSVSFGNACLALLMTEISTSVFLLAAYFDLKRVVEELVRYFL